MTGAVLGEDEVWREFRAAGALLEGHFVLSSGLHSPLYLQCARVMADPVRGARLCAALALKVRARFGADAFDVVVSPALGGIVVGYELARQLACEALFVERVEGRFRLRRGFALAKGARVLVVEDVITTGGSSRECADAVAAAGGVVVGAACLVDRSGGRAEVGVPLVSLVALEVPVYAADAVPPALARLPAVKPGSRPAAS